MFYSTDLLRHLRKIIGSNIHFWRTRRKMRLGVLATLTNLSCEKLDSYEIGKDEIALDHILKIACALDTDISEFLKNTRT